MPRREIKCPECGMPKSQWTRNDGMGFEREGIWYCCQGCAYNTGCICRNDPRPVKRPKRRLTPRPVEGHRLAGRAKNPIVLK